MVITKDGKMKKNPTSKKTNTSASQAMILEQQVLITVQKTVASLKDSSKAVERCPRCCSYIIFPSTFPPINDLLLNTLSKLLLSPIVISHKNNMQVDWAIEESPNYLMFHHKYLCYCVNCSKGSTKLLQFINRNYIKQPVTTL